MIQCLIAFAVMLFVLVRLVESVVGFVIVAFFHFDLVGMIQPD